MKNIARLVMIIMLSGSVVHAQQLSESDKQALAGGLAKLFQPVVDLKNNLGAAINIALKRECAVVIKNISDKKTAFFIMGLYATRNKTALYYPSLKCYIDQAMISDSIMVDPGATRIFSINQDGKDLIESGSLVGVMLVAAQVDVNVDPLAGQYKGNTMEKGFWRINMDTGQRQWVSDAEAKANFGAKVIVTQRGTSYFTKVTSSWVSNPRKKKLRLEDSSVNNFEFPTDFVFDKKMSEDFTKPDYQTVIGAMQAAEEKTGDKIFKRECFNIGYLQTLSDEDVYKMYSIARNIIDARPVGGQTTLGSLFALGKYKNIASMLVQASIGVIITILSGGAAATMLADFIQQAITTGVDLAQEISDIKQRAQPVTNQQTLPGATAH